MNKRSKIIAVDFDGTLCKNTYPGIGAPNIDLIWWLIKQKHENGAKLILWTCRCGLFLDAAVEWCKNLGLIFDAVNDNLPEDIEAFYGINSRKVYADIYIDDKMLNFSAGISPDWTPKDEGIPEIFDILEAPDGSYDNFTQNFAVTS